MCLVFVGSRLGDSQPACIHDVVWHSAASVPHALNLDLEDELGFQKAVFHEKSLAVCVWFDTFCCFFRIIGFSQWMWPVRGRGGYQLKWFLLLPIWRLADDGKTTFVTDRFSRSMLLLSSKAMDDSVAVCGSLHCVQQNIWWSCCWKTHKLGMMTCN